MANDNDDLRFDLVRSPALNSVPKFVPNAQGRVTVESVGPVELMEVKVWGLPPNTDFDFFVIQVPNTPLRTSLVPGRYRDQPLRRGIWPLRWPF